MTHPSPPLTPETCPLCHHPEPQAFAHTFRPYQRCPNCALVFVPKAWHLSQVDEKALYDLHQNDAEDAGYRNFLSQLFNPVVTLLEPGAQGLDFGSGPGPTLSRMFHEAGFSCADYDPFYAPFPERLQQTYDFITVSEVAEHLRQPAEEFTQLQTCLKPGGVLGVMTRRIPSDRRFSDWHYQRDPSHICFYDETSFTWLARRHNLSLRLLNDNIALLIKSKNQA